MGFFDSIGDALGDVADFVGDVSLAPWNAISDVAEGAVEYGQQALQSLGPAANLIAPGIGAVLGPAPTDPPQPAPPQVIVLPTSAPSPAPAVGSLGSSFASPTVLLLLGGGAVALVLLLILRSR